MAALAAIACSQCDTANPLLSRHCRRCSHPLQAMQWSSRTGTMLETLPGSFPPAGTELKLSWSLPAGPDPARAVLATCGAVAVVASTGRTRLLSHAGTLLADWQPHAGDSLVAHPVTLQGMLILPLSSGVYCLDLLHLTGLNGPTHSRSGVLEARGQCAGHLGVSDQGDFALVTQSRAEVRAWLGKPQGGLKPAWMTSEVIDQSSDQRVYGCCFAEDRLWICNESGALWALCRESGRLLGDWNVGRPILPESLQARGEHVVVAGVSQELFSWRPREEQWSSLWLPDASPIFAVTLGPGVALVVAANQLTWVSLDTRAMHPIVLPEKAVAPPLVGANGAVLVSYTGTLYVFNCSDRGPRLRASLRLQSRLDGCVLPPLLLQDQIVLTGHHGELASVGCSAPEQAAGGNDLGDQLSSSLTLE